MQIFVSNSLKFTAIGLVPAKSHACLGFVLTVFMALSGPIVAQACTPSITLAQMSFICSCSSSLSFPSTKPTCCPRPKSFPMPTRIRAYSCVPISSVMLASPLWPPALPFLRSRSVPKGMFRSSYMTMRFSAGIFSSFIQ